MFHASSVPALALKACSHMTLPQIMYFLISGRNPKDDEDCWSDKSGFRTFGLNGGRPDLLLDKPAVHSDDAKLPHDWRKNYVDLMCAG